MNFILGNWVKYYTKEAFKTLKIVAVGSTIILSVAFIKYRPVYKVTLFGESIGYVEDKDLIEKKINKYLEDISGNIAFREISELPKYNIILVDRDKEVKEKEVMLAVENKVTTTYKTFAITQDGEKKAEVSTIEEAENIINEMNKNLNKKIDLKLGVVEVYSTELNLATESEAKEVINEIKVAKVKEYEAAKRAAEKAAAAKAMQLSQVPQGSVSLDPVGSLNGMSLVRPVNGIISSRFGARSGSRSSSHTGLDIACSMGTPIGAASSGTVIYAAPKGSYGNLIILDHGNGVQTYYAHCTAIYVSAGQYVNAGTTIGTVGSTGNSTGPHLHLEIRINGSPVNPQNYLY